MLLFSAAFVFLVLRCHRRRNIISAVAISLVCHSPTLPTAELLARTNRPGRPRKMHGAKTPNVLRLSHLAIFVSFYLFLCLCVFLASWQQPFPIAETIFFSRSLCKTLPPLFPISPLPTFSSFLGDEWQRNEIFGLGGSRRRGKNWPCQPRLSRKAPSSPNRLLRHRRGSEFSLPPEVRKEMKREGRKRGEMPDDRRPRQYARVWVLDEFWLYERSPALAYNVEPTKLDRTVFTYLVQVPWAMFRIPSSLFYLFYLSVRFEVYG